MADTSIHHRLLTAVLGKVLVITGAGVSAESGIPTFRGADGYWRKMRPEDLATERAFRQDPALVWEWYRERRVNVRTAQPNPAHLAIAELARRAREFLLVTQNVDDLHERGGMGDEQLVHIHGRLFVDRCLAGDYETTALVSAGLPECPRCRQLLRPGVVWFGEMLNGKDVARVETFIEGDPCDVVLVVGTTAVFGYIKDWAIRGAGSKGLIVEINPDETELSASAHLRIRKRAGEAVPELVRMASLGFQ